MPGVYRCDYPDAAFAAGVNMVICSIVVASANNAVAAPILVDIEASVAQTGDSYARLGAPAGASIAADLLVIDNFVDGLETTIGSAGAGLTALSTAAALAIAQADLDIITGATGVNLLTATQASIDAILVDTGTTLDARIPAALVGGRMASNAEVVGDKTGYALTSADHIVGADTLLDRDMSTGVDSGSPTVRTVRQSFRALRNKWTNAAGTYSVYKENDTTVSWTSTIGTDAAAVPIVSSDPA
jgi:hypothetical protein